MSVNPKRLLLNNVEASDLLSISPRTLVNMRLAGEIPFVRLRDGTKGIRYSTEALREWIAKRQQRIEPPCPNEGAG
jgi:excisionase family DNA binding protein